MSEDYVGGAVTASVKQTNALLQAIYRKMCELEQPPPQPELQKKRKRDVIRYKRHQG